MFKKNQFVRVKSDTKAVYQETQETLANIVGRILGADNGLLIVNFPKWGVSLHMAADELESFPTESVLDASIEVAARNRALVKWYQGDTSLTKFPSFKSNGQRYVIFTGDRFVHFSQDTSVPHGYWGRWYTGLFTSNSAHIVGDSLKDVLAQAKRKYNFGG